MGAKQSSASAKASGEQRTQNRVSYYKLLDIDQQANNEEYVVDSTSNKRRATLIN